MGRTVAGLAGASSVWIARRFVVPRDMLWFRAGQYADGVTSRVLDSQEYVRVPVLIAHTQRKLRPWATTISTPAHQLAMPSALAPA